MFVKYQNGEAEDCSFAVALLVPMIFPGIDEFSRELYFLVFFVFVFSAKYNPWEIWNIIWEESGKNQKNYNGL